jgi:hypothetical protein
MRDIVKEEVSKVEKRKTENDTYQTEGLTFKSLYKITEVCSILK